jgi:hypothetical protein
VIEAARIRRKTVDGSLPGALAILLAVGLFVAGCGSDGSQSADTTTTIVPPTTTTSTIAETTTTTDAASIDASTPLGVTGVGPIEAGMTVARARDASGLAIELSGSLSEFGGHCYYVELEGQPDLLIRVLSPDQQPVTDAAQGVITAISIHASDPDGPSTRRTTGGVGLGATEAEVRAAHGDVIDEQPHDYVPGGAYLYVRPADSPGFGLRYVLDEHRVVTSIDAGTTTGITASEGCV